MRAKLASLNQPGYQVRPTGSIKLYKRLSFVSLYRLYAKGGTVSTLLAEVEEPFFKSDESFTRTSVVNIKTQTAWLRGIFPLQLVVFVVVIVVVVVVVVVVVGVVVVVVIVVVVVVVVVVVIVDVVLSDRGLIFRMIKSN